MDGGANWRPTQGADPAAVAAAGGVDPNAAAPAGSDWRTQLQPEARHRIVNKMYVLSILLPSSSSSSSSFFSFCRGGSMSLVLQFDPCTPASLSTLSLLYFSIFTLFRLDTTDSIIACWIGFADPSVHLDLTIRGLPYLSLVCLPTNHPMVCS